MGHPRFGLREGLVQRETLGPAGENAGHFGMTPGTVFTECEASGRFDRCVVPASLCMRDATLGHRGGAGDPSARW